MSSALKKLARLALVSVAVALVAPGCSQQGEGERCDKDKNGDADCESGLICTPKESLNGQLADRCCPTPGTETDKRCTPGTGPTGTAGSSNSGTAGRAGSSSNEGGGDAGGAPSDNGGTAGEGGSTTPSAGSSSMSDAGQSVGGDAPTAAGGNGAGGTP